MQVLCCNQAPSCVLIGPKCHSMCSNCYLISMRQVVRENQVIIVVGETGSGKTTQLTQVCSLIECNDHMFILS